MRGLIRTFLLSASVLSGIALAANAQAPTQAQKQPTKTLKAVPNFVPVTDATMREPRPENWQMHRGNYAAWGFSPLDQINKGNVKSLQLAWSRAMEPASIRRRRSSTTG
jgi:alcohol dehydrogenase (cytochrome c)